MEHIAIVVLSVAVVLVIAMGFYAAGRRLSMWLSQRPPAPKLQQPVEQAIVEPRDLRCCLAGVTDQEGERDPVCKEKPVRRRVLIASDDGFFDFVRRQFGAPNKLRAHEDVYGKDELCEIHFQLAMTEASLNIARHEAARIEFERNAEAQRQHFQRRGLSQILRGHIIASERRTISRASGGRARKAGSMAEILPYRASKKPSVAKAVGGSK